MNTTSISRVHAILAIKHIKRIPYSTTREICEALSITPAQFQAATPYIKSECERVKLEWYMKDGANHG